jgi:hypothetical protein
VAGLEKGDRFESSLKQARNSVFPPHKNEEKLRVHLVGRILCTQPNTDKKRSTMGTKRRYL